MRRSEIEKLTTVSIRGELYVKVDEVLELIKARDAEAEKPAEPPRAVPRQQEKA